MSKTLTFGAWESYIASIRDNVKKQPQAEIDRLDAVMAIDFEEHFKFQALKSEAMLAGRIDVDVAQAICLALGDVYTEYNGGWADGVDLATKVTITKIMEELLSLKLRKILKMA